MNRIVFKAGLGRRPMVSQPALVHVIGWGDWGHKMDNSMHKVIIALSPLAKYVSTSCALLWACACELSAVSWVCTCTRIYTGLLKNEQQPHIETPVTERCSSQLHAGMNTLVLFVWAPWPFPSRATWLNMKILMFPFHMPQSCGGRSVCLVMLEGCGHASGHETAQTQPVSLLKERRMREREHNWSQEDRYAHV